MPCSYDSVFHIWILMRSPVAYRHCLQIVSFLLSPYNIHNIGAALLNDFFCVCARNVPILGRKVCHAFLIRIFGGPFQYFGISFFMCSIISGSKILHGLLFLEEIFYSKLANFQRKKKAQGDQHKNSSRLGLKKENTAILLDGNFLQSATLNKLSFFFSFARNCNSLFLFISKH